MVLALGRAPGMETWGRPTEGHGRCPGPRNDHRPGLPLCPWSSADGGAAAAEAPPPAVTLSSDSNPCGRGGTSAEFRDVNVRLGSEGGGLAYEGQQGDRILRDNGLRSRRDNGRKKEVTDSTRMKMKMRI